MCDTFFYHFLPFYFWGCQKWYLQWLATLIWAGIWSCFGVWVICGLQEWVHDGNSCEATRHDHSPSSPGSALFNVYSDYEVLTWHVQTFDKVDDLPGNLLECLESGLNHFDQHHLDRLLKASGQVPRAGGGVNNNPSPSHHHFYRWYGYHSQVGGLWHCFAHIKSL